MVYVNGLNRDISGLGHWIDRVVSCCMVNPTKSGVSGMLYGVLSTGMICRSLLHDKSIRMLETRLQQVTLDGETIPFYHPPTQPYSYWG